MIGESERRRWRLSILGSERTLQPCHLTASYYSGGTVLNPLTGPGAAGQYYNFECAALVVLNQSLFNFNGSPVTQRLDASINIPTAGAFNAAAAAFAGTPSNTQVVNDSRPVDRLPERPLTGGHVHLLRRHRRRLIAVVHRWDPGRFQLPASASTTVTGTADTGPGVARLATICSEQFGGNLAQLRQLPAGPDTSNVLTMIPSAATTA